MQKYEAYIVLPPEATPDVRKTQLKALEDLIIKFKGKLLQKNEVGRKKLGYKIRKFQDGYVVVLDYQLEPSQQESLRKNLQLQQDVIKYMITKPGETKVSSLEKAPQPPRVLRPSNPATPPKVVVP